MVVTHMWTKTTCLFFRRPTALAYLTLCTFPCFAILITSSKVMLSWMVVHVSGEHLFWHVSVLFVFSVLFFGHALMGSLKSLICCSTSLFYDPLVWENVWLFTEWWVIQHIAPHRKKSNWFTQSLGETVTVLLQVTSRRFLNIYRGGLWHCHN